MWLKKRKDKTRQEKKRRLPSLTNTKETTQSFLPSCLPKASNLNAFLL
jgi:hypothetical protein